MHITFGPSADPSLEYQLPEWLETNEPQPEDRPTLARRAKTFGNFAIHTNLVFASKDLKGSVFVHHFEASPHASDTQGTFMRVNFHSYFTEAVRGKSEFGGSYGR